MSSTNLKIRPHLVSAEIDNNFFLIPGTYKASLSVKALPFTIVRTMVSTPFIGYKELSVHVIVLLVGAVK